MYHLLDTSTRCKVYYFHAVTYKNLLLENSSWWKCLGAVPKQHEVFESADAWNQADKLHLSDPSGPRGQQSP